MPRFAANLSFLWTKLPFRSRFEAASKVGFKHVEFMFPGDGGYHLEAAVVRGELDRWGLQQVLVNAPAGDWAAGERGLAGLPVHREAEWRAAFQHGLDFVVAVGCPRMHVMAGRVSDGGTEDLLKERLAWAADVAAAHGVCILIEALNPKDFPGYLVPDCTSAVQILDDINRPRHCKLQFDLYHHSMTAGGAALIADLPKLLPYIGHMQVASPPGRNEPGHGEVNFEPVFKLIDDLGYDGLVGCEYRPSTETTEESLRWAKIYGIGAVE